MRPLDLLALFLILAIAIVQLHDTQQDEIDAQNKTNRFYTDSFRSAVQDTGSYLARFESQQVTTSVRYSKEKQISFDKDMINVFLANLSMKFGIYGDPVKVQNLMLHIPAMSLIQYDGYVMVTIDDTASPDGNQYLTPVLWPKRPYTYKLPNGNILYFTHDDRATIYDCSSNTFLKGDYDELSLMSDLSPIDSKSMFYEVRQATITSTIEKDLTGAMNRHLELVKKLGLTIQMNLPRGIAENSIQNVGFLAFIQGYPMPDGEYLNLLSFGGGAIRQGNEYVGTWSSGGQYIAYGSGCVPSSGVTVMERLFDATEAVKKGYFIKECS
ncbi:hypothetical protein [Paenibacillus cremeus]|uniref:Uncharacterized protein n=1 Tax=Paenibacillus cremeus TaxID=2163881 RepID=A0A559K5B2_9BACL|nr:hypothetical protein [Paenibacillus cremeus]TVY07322.1 hypothetical protein FPZ49_24575 [Paenibacillus cremeus]